MRDAYPAPRRSSAADALAFAENERLFERDLDRPAMNALMERLQLRLGSKNKLAEAVYNRKNGASQIKQLIDGTSRYSDAVIDQVMRLARIHGVLEEAPEPSPAAPAPVEAANDDQTGLVVAAPEEEAAIVVDETPTVVVPEVVEPVAADVEDAAIVVDETPPGVVPEVVEPVAADVEHTVSEEPVLNVQTERPQAAPTADWLQSIRERRGDLVVVQTTGAETETALQARIAELQDELANRREENAAVAAQIAKVDEAMAILEAI